PEPAWRSAVAEGEGGGAGDGGRGAAGVVSADLRHHVHGGIDDAGAQRRGGRGEGGRVGERDASQRAVLVEQGQLHGAHGAHTSVSGSSVIRRPSAELVRPASARRTPRAPERKSKG